ncbi:MAG: DUF86 domain-containing protein [Candidatus Electryonea clarkiae]|nr:DUF86 domain-containing protein [Candidatus Electryonea clarkiae]MDP8287616.1 DUF86 domain-containing protein [Candidatus Electryonea clarkiae]
MVEQDILLAKVSIIKRCLDRIWKVTKSDPGNLDNFDVQDIFVLNLQRAIQAAIDLASHLIASEGWGVPETLKANFDLLHLNGVYDANLAKKLKSMVGFRNIAVHDYQGLDVDILKSILRSNLGDLETFYKILLKKYSNNQD